MQSISFDSSTGQSPQPLPDSLEEGIVRHTSKERFVDSPTFVALLLAFFVVFGCVVGIFLAL